MKPHPRPPILRKTIMWGGAAVTVLLVIAWIASGWWHAIWWGGDDTALFIGGGAVAMHQQQSWPGLGSYDPGWRLVSSAPQFVRTLVLDRTGEYWDITIPYWVPAVPLLFSTLAAWRLDTLACRCARGGVNLCPKCDYDRAGIARDAKCPECGAVPTSA